MCRNPTGISVSGKAETGSRNVPDTNRDISIRANSNGNKSKNLLPGKTTGKK
jgi:hypothetical protein